MSGAAARATRALWALVVAVVLLGAFLAGWAWAVQRQRAQDCRSNTQSRVEMEDLLVVIAPEVEHRIRNAYDQLPPVAACQ